MRITAIGAANVRLVFVEQVTRAGRDVGFTPRHLGAAKRVRIAIPSSTRSLAALSVLTLLGAASPGFAQVLEEIVVTAERRETSLQQTPISVAAFDAETMEIKGIETMEDVAIFTPNLDIKGSRGSGNVNPTYQIRGLSGGGGATGERSAAMYIDGVYMPRTSGPFMTVLDISRIEVLRGPQGTLFGRNSTGGAIRVFTKQPSAEPEGSVKLAFGDFDRADLSASYNIPLGDTTFLRLQGASLNQDGYVRRGSQELGGAEETLFRAQLALEPSDDLRVAFALTSTDSESDGNPQDLATFDMRPDLNYEGQRADWVSDFLEAAGQPRIAPFNDPRIVLDDYTMPDWCFLDDADPDWDADCEQRNDAELDLFSVNVEWRISDGLTFTSITGLSEYDMLGFTDWVMLGTERRPESVESESVYQELQLNLSTETIDFVTGVSYFQEDTRSAEFTLDARGTSAFPPQLALGNAYAGVFRTNDTVFTQDSESWGLFANLTWNITDRLALTPGVRFAFDEKTVVGTEFNSDNFTAVASDGTSTTVVAPYDEDDTDWRLTVDYDINDELMIYATASKSFRAGALALGMGGIRDDISGADQTAQFAVSPPFTPPESVQSNEVGLRSEFADGRVRFNITYFDMKYSDRQAPVQVLDPSVPTGFRIVVQDSGDVDLTGIELDGQIAATENLMIDFSAGLLDPDLLDPCANNGDFLFPGPAESSYSLGLNWAKPMSSGRRFSWALSYAWVGEQQTHPGSTNLDCGTTGPPPGWPAAPAWFFDSRYELPDYGLLNGRVSLASADGTWNVTLFANNLTDEVYANYATRFGGGFWDFTPPWVQPAIQVHERSALGNTMGRPRDVGVSFQYNFGER